jgi:membrane-associated phospholipid phosphatase
MTKDFLRAPFITFSISVIIIFTYAVLVFPKGALVMLVNEYHNEHLDQFFKYVTYFGDGALMAIVLLGLLFYSYRISILALFSVVFQAIIVSLFKRWLFKGLARPTAFIDDFDWHYIDGVDVHASNTFPSGHTTTAFALFGLMVVVFSNRGYFLNLVFFLLAIATGFSRIYLLQHFAVDVYFGAIFGIISVVLSLVLMEQLFSRQKLSQLQNSSLRSLLFKKADHN